MLRISAIAIELVQAPNPVDFLEKIFSFTLPLLKKIFSKKSKNLAKKFHAFRKFFSDFLSKKVCDFRKFFEKIRADFLKSAARFLTL